MFSNPLSIADIVKLFCVGAVCIALGTVAGTWHGKSLGKAEAAAEAAANSVRILKERGKIDEKVTASDAAALCSDFGLSDDDYKQCLSRLESATSKP